MEIREIRDEETVRAGEVVVEAYSSDAESPPIEDNGYAVQLRSVAERAREATVLVAVDEGELVGCVTYVPDETSPYAEELLPGEASMRMLGVAPWARRRGIGRALAGACVDRAAAAGKVRVFLHSGRWMHAAHAMYESLGFVRVPERDWVPVAGVELLGFALELGGDGGGR